MRCKRTLDPNAPADVVRDADLYARWRIAHHDPAEAPASMSVAELHALFVREWHAARRHAAQCYFRRLERRGVTWH